MKNIADRLNAIKNEGLYRTLKNSKVLGSKILVANNEYLNFASNDYLGISERVNWQKDFIETQLNSCDFLMSSSSSRLMGCNSEAFEDFEDFMSNIYTEIAKVEKNCLFFNCGYHANSGILPAIATSKDLVIIDKLSHASLIDSLKLTDAKWLRFPHNDYDKLDEILSKCRNDYENVFIATESIFSMDGDCADLNRLVDIKKRHSAFLYVDEAHAFGVCGKSGMGMSANSTILKDIDLIMCTLGKASSAEGAFVICNFEIKELLINMCRTLIYTTAISPLMARWAKFVCKKIINMNDERLYLQNLKNLFKLNIVSCKILGDSQIIPVIIGENSKAVKISSALAESGIYVPAVRYPTVPKGSARLRFSLSASHSEADIVNTARLMENLLKV